MLFLGISMAMGQTRQILTWKESLRYIQQLPGKEMEEQREEIARIRTAVEFWIRLHPDTTISLQPAPQQLDAEVKLLREAVDSILAEDRGQAFQLGQTVIAVSAEISPLSPVTDSVDHKVIENFNAISVTDAIQYIPGLTLDAKQNRNQTGILMRGFDTRQIGLYLDSIPIMVPYDGYADVNRFLASDIAVIEVAKGYSSPHLGPNGLAGAVNMVTRSPEKKLQGDLSIGTGSGDMLQSGFHVGSRFDKFFFRGGMDWFQQDYFPLSGNFPLIDTAEVSQPTYERLNSDKRDIRYSGRAGLTPNATDQYVFSYAKQKADYGVPTYAGPLTADDANINHRRWGYWNRDSYYLNTKTQLGSSSDIKFRIFYDKYPNNFQDYYREPQVPRNLKYSSYYDDSSLGFASEFSTRIVPRNTLSASFTVKRDIHKERQDFVNRRGVLSIYPEQEQKDRTLSIGVQDILNISSRMKATVGFSLDHQAALKAMNLDDDLNVVPFECNGQPNDSFSSCLAHNWSFNPLASVSYAVADSGSLYFTFALKSRFPTLKDRYSYKNGQAIPNPELQPEHSRNYSLGYSHTFGATTMMQLELFRSDVYDAISKDIIPAPVPGICESFDPDGLLCQRAINIAKELHQGVEFAVRTSPVRRLNLNMNYSYVQKSVDTPIDMEAPYATYPTGTPKHKAVGIANIQLPYSIEVIASARYEAGAWTKDRYDSFLIPASNFATADLGGSFRLYRGVKLQVGVKNLFDRYYYYEQGYPEAGRNWYFNSRYEF